MRIRTAVRMLGGRLGLAVLVVVAAMAIAATAAAGATAPSFATATNSSPVTLSRDGRLLWSVNPAADTVSVISTKKNTVLKTIKVGDEPQGVAVDPANRYAYVANAAAGTVSVIRITDASAKRFKAGLDKKRVKPRGQLATGSEPWNIVASPDGKRIFVANSSQDTITVIDAVGTKKKPLDKTGPRVIGNVLLRGSRCSPDPAAHFQPRGLAVTKSSKGLLVTSFEAVVRPGGRQGSDQGRNAVVCLLKIKTSSTSIGSYKPKARITLGSQDTGFKVDASGDGIPDATAAFPNQLQSVVIRGNQAFLPGVAASPSGPLRFNVDTEAFVSVLNGANSGGPTDAGAGKFINLHLGAQDPEPGKKKLFFANPWAIGFTTQSGAGQAYVVSAGSDLLVKANVAGDGKLSNTVDADTTRYIDLNDPNNPATSGDKAGKNPQGIVVNAKGTRAYVQNFVSRNLTVVDLKKDAVKTVIRTAPLPPPGSPAEVVAVGAEMFFSSRGHFSKPPGLTVSTDERLSQTGWQSCSSCHFKGLTDGIVWTFPPGPRKSIPLNATFNPRNRAQQRILNYSAQRDENEDFDINTRNVSGPGPLAAAQACSAPPPATSLQDPNHGLILGDADPNLGPCVINDLVKPNANRNQVTVRLPGSSTEVPAATALREWVRNAIRTPNAAVRSTKLGGPSPSQVTQGRVLFTAAGCAACHGGQQWTRSILDFTPPPAATEIFTETTPPKLFGNPVAAQYLNRFLRNIGSFNRGVPGGGNELPPNIGADEKATQVLTNGVAGAVPDALGTDYNGDGKGFGFAVPSLLGIDSLPPYYHNGACETLTCVVGDVKHRTANGTRPDGLPQPGQRAAVVAFLRSIDNSTQPTP